MYVTLERSKNACRNVNVPAIAPNGLAAALHAPGRVGATTGHVATGALALHCCDPAAFASYIG